MKQAKLWMMAAILLFCGTTVLTSCDKDDDNAAVVKPTKEYFTLWNQCVALTALQEYVKDVTNPNSLILSRRRIVSPRLIWMVRS